jgi:hypothetical protein
MCTAGFPHRKVVVTRIRDVCIQVCIQVHKLHNINAIITLSGDAEGRACMAIMARIIKVVLRQGRTTGTLSSTTPVQQ